MTHKALSGYGVILETGGVLPSLEQRKAGWLEKLP